MFKKVIDVNLVVLFIFFREVVKWWCELKIKGCIVNIVLVFGLMVELEWVVYVVLKYVLIGLIK